MNKIQSRTHRLCRLLPAALALILLLFAAGCKDDEKNDPVPENPDYGEEQRIELAADLSSVVPTGDITCQLVYGDEKVPVSVKSVHSVESGKSVIRLDERLRIGRYILASIIHKTGEETYDEANIGCTLQVTTRSNAVSPSTFDKLAGYFGSGTAEDPYRIATSTGFKVMRKLMEDGANSFEGKYFLQTADIDMVDSYNKGFRPIAHQPAFPFKGCYDGGGHAIRYCAIRTLDSKTQDAGDEIEATGLFGYVCAATFRDITMIDPVAIGAGSTGTLIGCIRGISGVEETPTYLRNIRVRKESSSASEVYGTNFVGGLVGGVDAQAVLVMHSCVNENLPVGNRSDGSFAGGLVGGGTINATAILDSCVNLTRVQADGSRCAGGIIGGIEAANITNCINRGAVIAHNCLATGGIAGGLGTSTLAVVVNEGEIRGREGTGGIVGSTVINKEDGSYNDLIMTSAHNYGPVYGVDNTGGLIGEAQTLMADCYNRAMVEGTGDFAGGLAGFAPTAVVNHCFNNGQVGTAQCAGGLIGRASYYIMTNSSNLASVDASAGMAGGILGLGGSSGMINFCNNYGRVSGTDICGGIAARTGDSKSLTGGDIASVIISYGRTKHKVMKALKTPPKEMSSMKAAFKHGKNVIKIASSAKDLYKAIATPPMLQDISMWDDLYGQKIDIVNEDMLARMNKEVSAAIPAVAYALPGSEALPGLAYANSVEFNNSLEGEGDDRYSDAIHNRLAEINKQVAKIEQARKIALAAASCVLAVAGAVVSGGAATASVIVLSAAVSTVGDMTERMDNCVEVSQCSNFGTVSAGKKGYGIVARLGDHVKLHNCLSVGAASGYGVSDVSLDVLDDVKVRRIVSVGTVNQEPFSNSYCYENQGLFFLADKKGTWGSEIGYRFADELARQSTYTSVESPFDFDDNKSWAFLSPVLPQPYNNLYYSFR